MTLDDLAARWSSTLEMAKRTVKLRRVPHLDLSAGGMRIVWSQVRFRLADIERWEEENLNEFGGEPEPEPVSRGTRGGREGGDYWD